MAQIAILERKCARCGLCAQSCPFGAIDLRDGLPTINEACRACGACVRACPQGAVLRLEARAQSVDKSQWRDILVFAEVSGGRLHPVALELIGKARELAAPLGYAVKVALIGSGMEPYARELQHYGPSEIAVYDDPALEGFRADVYAACLEDHIRAARPCVVLIGATSLGRSLAPRLATRFRTGLTADCTRLLLRENSDLVQIRPAFGGNIMAQIVTTRTRPQFATVRYKVMDAPMRMDAPAGEIVRRALPAGVASSRAVCVRLGEPAAKAQHIRRGDTGGRRPRPAARGGDLALVRELAAALRGDWAVTRPLVEKGWAANDRQIGLSGRTVRPKLIITCGVSGAIQFTSCMDSSEHIVAINTDPDAPIFAVAHIAITGDLYKIVPALLELLKEAMGVMAFKRVDAEDLAFFERIMPGRAHSGAAISTDHMHDEMTEYGSFAPDAVLLAEDRGKRSARYCATATSAKSPSPLGGAGTGLCGGCVAIHGGVVLSSERMKRVLEVDARNMTATLEPGVLLMEFPKSLEGTGALLSAGSGRKDRHDGRECDDQRRRHARGALWRDARLRAGYGRGPSPTARF